MNRNHLDSFAPYPGFFGGESSHEDESQNADEKAAHPHANPGREKRGSRHKKRGEKRTNGSGVAQRRFRSNLPKRRYLSALANSVHFEDTHTFCLLSEEAWANLFSPMRLFHVLRAEAASATERVLNYLAEKRAALHRMPGLSFWKQAALQEASVKATALKTVRREAASTRRDDRSGNPRGTARRAAHPERGKDDFMIAMFTMQVLGLGIGAVAGVMPMSVREAALGALFTAALAGVLLLAWPGPKETRAAERRPAR